MNATEKRNMVNKISIILLYSRLKSFVFDIEICPNMKNGIAESEESRKNGKSTLLLLQANPPNPAQMLNATLMKVECLGILQAILFIIKYMMYTSNNETRNQIGKL